MMCAVEELVGLRLKMFKWVTKTSQKLYSCYQTHDLVPRENPHPIIIIAATTMAGLQLTLFPKQIMIM